MQIIYSLTELEKLLAEESKRRIGYTATDEALITAKAGRVMAEGDEEGSTAVIIIEVALPEAVADDVLVPESAVASVKGGTVRGRKAGAKKGGSKKK